MPIRLSMGHIKKLLVYFNMKLLRKGKFIYGGLGKDGIWRTCKFDYHKDNLRLKTPKSEVIVSFAFILQFKDFP